MLTKTITYYDLNGDQQTETLMFNLTTVELARLSKRLTPQGQDLQWFINDIITRNDTLALLDTIATIMIESSGVKSADGKRFIKNQQTKDDFENSVAFAEYLELVMGEPEEAMEFIKNVFASEKAKQQLSNLTVDDVLEATPQLKVINNTTTSKDVLAAVKEVPQYTSEELEKAMELLRNSNNQ